jgi:hypothetical protein
VLNTVYIDNYHALQDHLQNLFNNFRGGGDISALPLVSRVRIIKKRNLKEGDKCERK